MSQLPEVTAILREDFRNLLDDYPLFRDFFWKHSKSTRTTLIKDWQERYENEEYDYSGKSKNMREWVQKLIDGGAFSEKISTPTRYEIGQKILCRDKGEDWQQGTIKSISPLRIKPTLAIKGNWKDSVWHDIKAVTMMVGMKVRCRDAKSNFKCGIIKGINPIRVETSPGAGSHKYDVVEELPPIIYSSHTSETPSDCSICLEGIVVKQITAGVGRSGCRHLFHKKCLLKWFETSPSCPLCRTSEGIDNNQMDCSDTNLKVGSIVTMRGTSGLATITSITSDGILVDSTNAVESLHSPFDLLSDCHPPKVGSELQIVNLEGPNSNLNKQSGKCVGYLRDRAVIQLEGTEEKKAFKIMNLRLL